MNELGLLLVAGVARVTALAAVGVVLAVALRRRDPAAVALVAMTTLSGLVAVSALSLSPWPRFCSIDLAATVGGPATAGRAGDSASGPVAGQGGAAAPGISDPPAARDTRLTDFARAFFGGLRAPASRPATGGDGRWRWPAWVAAGLLAAASLGVARLALAVRAVAALRRKSRPILDARLGEEVGRLRAATGCPRPVEVRETQGLSTPATVGWLRPVLLLPPDWREWDDAERRAVLAHELGHIRRGDYLSGLWAQTCLALHAYHPLAHWLAARLRLEQELAADAWGARLLGGNRPYLEALARLALRRPGPIESSPAAWPARPFLPTRGTLLRRIEMLRETAPDTPRTEPLPPLGRVLTVAALASAGLLLAGLRGPASSALARQDQSPPGAADAGVEKANARVDVFDLSHAPINTMLAVSGRPAAVLARPEFRPVADLLSEPRRNPMAGSLALKPEEVDGVVVLVFGAQGGGVPPMPPTIIFHATRPQDWKAVAGTYIKGPEVVQFEGQSYTRAKTPPTGAAYFTPDDRTIVIGPEDALQQVITARKGGPIRHAWDGAWSRVKKGQVAFAFDPAWALTLIPPAALAGPARVFAPLLEKATGYAAGLDLDDGLGVDLVATCSSAEGARSVKETMQALFTLSRNALSDLRQHVGTRPAREREMTLKALALGEPLLTNVRAEVDGGEPVVRVRSRTDGDLAVFARAILPAVTAARGAARRSQSVNNLKQIGLAMHNFVAIEDHFPPAVGRAAAGKPPYSWRVALLPYIEANDLFKEYNFDEPWDGPSNRKLIDRMPAIYGYPGEPREAGKTAYFVVTGGPTLFPPGKPGVKIREVFDGTSNTLCVVEAKRDVPWTKPEDIAYDPNAPLPSFGGFEADGFNAEFADGSTHFLSSRLAPPVLKAILSRAGGEVLSADALHPVPSGPATMTPARTLTPPVSPRGR